MTDSGESIILEQQVPVFVLFEVHEHVCFICFTCIKKPEHCVDYFVPIAAVRIKTIVSAEKPNPAYHFQNELV